MYAFQHVLAMFVANSLIAILVYANYGVNMVPAALISAGIGTLFYLAITRLRSPVFLGSSAGLMPVMATCLAMGSIASGN
jgi:uracil permease